MNEVNEHTPQLWSPRVAGARSNKMTVGIDHQAVMAGMSAVVTTFDVRVCSNIGPIIIIFQGKTQIFDLDFISNLKYRINDNVHRFRDDLESIRVILLQQTGSHEREDGDDIVKKVLLQKNWNMKKNGKNSAARIKYYFAILYFKRWILIWDEPDTVVRWRSWQEELPVASVDWPSQNCWGTGRELRCSDNLQERKSNVTWTFKWVSRPAFSIKHFFYQKQSNRTKINKIN